MNIQDTKEAVRASALSVGRFGLHHLAETHPVFLRSLMEGIRFEPDQEASAESSNTDEHSEANDRFLRDLYEKLLGRPIDLDALNGFRAALARGTSRADIVLTLALSDEYKARCQQRGGPVRSGTPRAKRPGSYQFDTEGYFWTFKVQSDADFDWLEDVIVKDGYYEHPGVWSLVVDTDKRLMAEIVALLSRGRVLEMGCSTGAVLGELQSRGLSVEGIDVSALAIERASDAVRPHIHHGDLLSLDLSNDFDTVLGLDIFEHLNPNRLAEYLNRLRSCLLPGGLLVANIPAYGRDEIFGEVLPYYIQEWTNEAADNKCFRTLHVDDDGYPENGHLIWADTRWWVSQFEAAGFIRRPKLEIALHQKYDSYLSVHDRFRQALYVFSAGDCPDEKILEDRIHASESPLLDECAAVMG